MIPSASDIQALRDANVKNLVDKQAPQQPNGLSHRIVEVRLRRRNPRLVNIAKLGELQGEDDYIHNASTDAHTVIPLLLV